MSVPKASSVHATSLMTSVMLRRRAERYSFSTSGNPERSVMPARSTKTVLSTLRAMMAVSATTLTGGQSMST